MSFGFRIRRADGTVKFDSDSIAVLFIDDFLVASGSVTNTYAGLAGANLTVIGNPTDSLSSGATITQAVSGSAKQVTVSVSRPGRFRVMME